MDAPKDGMIEKTRKIQEDYVYDFVFDDRKEPVNIKIIDKKNIHNNFLQVVNQVTAGEKNQNRYDVTILVNGLPLVHIELKKRGVNLHEAFNQIHRYSKESFNLDHSLYKFVQIFVISNGTYTRYFANTTAKNKNNYEFTCEWADAKNKVIRDLEDFTKTFFEKRVILEVLTKYCVFDASNTLLIMRPYQIAATERILWKIKSSYEGKKAGTAEAGGFIWHTTGSGKTLTSFKTARLATNLDFIDKVFFVVDRKDLDYQTMKEYKRFQEDSVNGSKDTKELKKSIEILADQSQQLLATEKTLFAMITPKLQQAKSLLIRTEPERQAFDEYQKLLQFRTDVVTEVQNQVATGKIDAKKLEKLLETYKEQYAKVLHTPFKSPVFIENVYSALAWQTVLHDSNLEIMIDELITTRTLNPSDVKKVVSMTKFRDNPYEILNTYGMKDYYRF